MKKLSKEQLESIELCNGACHECPANDCDDCNKDSATTALLLMAQIEAQRQEIAQMQQWVNDLQSGMYVNCVYCGHRYGPESEVPVSMADALKEHIEKCPKHPMSLLKTELIRIKKKLSAALEHLSGHCEYCTFQNDCAKHDNNDSNAGFTWWTDCEDWEWIGASSKGAEV